MNMYNRIRSYRTKQFRVDVMAHPEHTDPADTIATGNDEADAAYVQSIRSGERPWYTLGVHVYWKDRLLSSSYLGCVDTLDLRGTHMVLDTAREAIEEARYELEALQRDLGYMYINL